MSDAATCKDAVGALPRNWERAFGYGGDAQLVAFHWDSDRDGAVYTDGRATGAGMWDLFLNLVEDLVPILQDNAPGIDWWLLLDRTADRFTITTRADAEHQVEQQWTAGQTPSPAIRITFADVLDSAFSSNGHGARGAMALCPACCSAPTPAPGWHIAEDGGFDMCDYCHGLGAVPTEKAR